MAYQNDHFPYSHKLQQQKEEMGLHPAVSSWISPERLSLTVVAKYDDRNLWIIMNFQTMYLWLTNW